MLYVSQSKNLLVSRNICISRFHCIYNSSSFPAFYKALVWSTLVIFPSTVSYWAEENQVKGMRLAHSTVGSAVCSLGDVVKTVLHLNPQLFNLRRYFTNPPEGRELFDWLVFFLSSTKQYVFSLNVESKQHLFYVLTFLLYSMIFSNAEWISLLSVVFSYVGCPWCFVGSLNTMANASKKKKPQ